MRLTTHAPMIALMTTVMMMTMMGVGWHGIGLIGV